MELIDHPLLESLASQAKASPRLRMNHNFHHSLDEKCHRFLNALEPGTTIPIHHHPTKDETVILLKGKVRVLTYNDSGEIQEDQLLTLDNRHYGVNIPKNVWHTIQCIESSILFECKEGPFVEHEVEGVLEVGEKFGKCPV